MAKSVKMYAVVDGKKTVVGRCHPGEARLLRKTGIAEWGKDGLLLNMIPEKSPNGTGPSLAVDESEGKGAHPNIRTAFGHRPRPLVAGEDYKMPLPPVEATLQTMKDWLEEIGVRRKAGHELYLMDNPRARKLGFGDGTTSEIFYVPLTRLKSWGGQDIPELVELGLKGSDLSECLRTEEGRLRLLGQEKKEPAFDWSQVSFSDFSTPEVEEDGGYVPREGGLMEEILTALAASELGLDSPFSDLLKEEGAPPSGYSPPTTGRDLLQECGYPEGWRAVDFPVFTGAPQQEIDPSTPAIWTTAYRGKAEGRLIFWVNRQIGFAQMKGKGWHYNSVTSDPASSGRTFKLSLKICLNNSPYHPAEVTDDSDKKVFGPWRAFRYPEDCTRVPLVHADGSPYSKTFTGLYQRDGEEIHIIPDGGKRFTAALAQGDDLLALLYSRGSYVVPDDAQFDGGGSLEEEVNAFGE